MPAYKSYRVLIGLEIHVQLATRSKMFTAAPNAANHFGAEPNTLVDEQILGLPGVLPVMNRRAVELSILTGLALNCRIARFSKWDRKSYYYPDLPKNYQISQYDLPLCGPGELTIDDETGQPFTIRIRRAHLEEDAGKLLHEAPGGYPIDHSIVDLNRAGTPLLEIVTEPDLTSAKQVALFAQELQKIVQFLGVSQGQMQMGHMRFEPNINLHITDEQGQVYKTAITEIKNLNSFSVLERATDYEIRRQLQEWTETGSLGEKATRGWDETTQSTFLQRRKEEAHDYRYFPDPDLMPVEVSDAWLEELKAQLVELPSARRRRYVHALGLSPKDADTLAGDRALGDYFEAALAIHPQAKRVADLIINPLAALAKTHGVRAFETAVDPAKLAQVATLIDQGKLPAGRAIEVFQLIEQKQRLSEQDLASAGLLVSNDTSAIDAAIDAALAANPKAVQDFRNGKQAALGSLVGAVMKSTKGLNPKTVQERLRARLSG